jgi:hypothetical protein
MALICACRYPSHIYMTMTLQKLVNLDEGREDEEDDDSSTSVEGSSPSITIRKGRKSLWTRMFKTLFPTSQITKKEKENDL